MRESKEIMRDLEANHQEIKKWLPHIKRESVKKVLEDLEKKDVELEKELYESLKKNII